MATKKRTYGRKTRPLLEPLFFESSPDVSELRRSPRVRKVLHERSSNVQPFSPSRSGAKHVQEKREALVVLDSEDEEPVIVSPLRRAKRRSISSGQTEAVDNLTDAINELSIAVPPVQTPSYAHFSTPVIPRSITRRPASSSFSTRRIPKPLKQHSVSLDSRTSSYLELLINCKNVSKTVESFSDWVEERTALLAFSKIGEGSYGQVFRATDVGGETVIIKLMPLNAQGGQKWQAFTTIESAATEVRLLEKMQKVPGYVEFRGACVLQGSMPEDFITLWTDYMESGRTVESRDPRLKGAYPANQLWLMLELSDAGTNLEPGRYMPPGIATIPKNGKYLPITRLWDIFWQVTHAVAKAEVYCEFEHRDLHLGNICVRNEPGSGEVFAAGPYPIDSTGSIVTIIDYTLSRANMDASETLAFDFQADEALLSGEGDLQYDIYRWMDDILGERGCKSYDPRTNVLWLFHLLEKLFAVTTAAPRGKAGQAMRSMRNILKKVQTMIDPDYMGEWEANSAGDLLQCAFAQEWIGTDA